MVYCERCGVLLDDESFRVCGGCGSLRCPACVRHTLIGYVCHDGCNYRTRRAEALTLARAFVDRCRTLKLNPEEMFDEVTQYNHTNEELFQ